MEVDRRSLMKGVLAGGALLAFGVPSWAFAGSPVRTPQRCVLVFVGTRADEVFARGARAACARVDYAGLQTVMLKGGLLTGTDRMITLMDRFRGARWIVVMDDANAVIFLELIRTAGARLLSMGTHACSKEHSCQVRHAWTTISPSNSPGALLASQFIQRHGSCLVTENFLQAPVEVGALISWSAPGFSSYRLSDVEAMHLHCSGLSLSDACGVIGLTTIEGWTAIPPQVCAGDCLSWEPENWVDSLGYAMTEAALGGGSVQESCSGRAFVHQSRNEDRTQPTERFMSFVIDV